MWISYCEIDTKFSWNRCLICLLFFSCAYATTSCQCCVVRFLGNMIRIKIEPILGNKTTQCAQSDELYVAWCTIPFHTMEKWWRDKERKRKRERKKQVYRTTRVEKSSWKTKKIGILCHCRWLFFHEFISIESEQSIPMKRERESESAREGDGDGERRTEIFTHWYFGLLHYCPFTRYSTHFKCSHFASIIFRELKHHVYWKQIEWNILLGIDIFIFIFC